MQKNYTESNSGTILFIVMSVMVLLSFYKIRRYLYTSFYRLHFLLILISILIAFIHGVSLIIAGLIFWVFDLIVRQYLKISNKENLVNVKIEQLPGDIIKISFNKKELKYAAGQYIFITVPELSYLESHPFSLSSSPYQEEVMILIRVLGDWTKRLYELSKDKNTVDIWIHGPYGALSIDINNTQKYQIFLFITGGIGITPLHSICNQLIHYSTLNRPLRKIFFVWSVKEKHMINSIIDT